MTESMLVPHLVFSSKEQGVLPVLGPYSSCKSSRLLLLWSSAHQRSQCPHVAISCLAPDVWIQASRVQGESEPEEMGRAMGRRGNKRITGEQNWGPQREDDSECRESHLQKPGSAVWDARGSKACSSSHNSGLKSFTLDAVWKLEMKFQSGDHVVINQHWISRTIWLTASCLTICYTLWKRLFQWLKLCASQNVCLSECLFWEYSKLKDIILMTIFLIWTELQTRISFHQHT